jgi:hypothetical protein
MDLMSKDWGPFLSAIHSLAMSDRFDMDRRRLTDHRYFFRV